jgi:hypothetical protein
MVSCDFILSDYALKQLVHFGVMSSSCIEWICFKANCPNYHHMVFLFWVHICFEIFSSDLRMHFVPNVQLLPFKDIGIKFKMKKDKFPLNTRIL